MLADGHTENETFSRSGKSRLYAILRTDIRMSPGKAGAQAGHAYVDTLLNGLSVGDACAQRYALLRPGTKILLGAPLWRMLEWSALAEYEGVPFAFIVDSGHVELPDFDGSPTPTALGLGPFDDERPMPASLARALRAARPWPPKGEQVFSTTPTQP